MARRHRDGIAVLIAIVVSVVLIVVVLDLTFAARLSSTDRAASLAALGAIGLALAHGLGKYMGDDDE